MPEKIRLAVFSPLPPQHTGVADYCAGLLPYWQELAQVTFFVSDPAKIEPTLHQQVSILPIDAYPAQRLHFDIPLYHLGNNRYHETIYDMAVRYPGVVLFHDYYLHPFLADRAARENNFTPYTRELAYAQGIAGINLSWQVRYGEATRPDYAFPLNDRLLDLSLGIIAHNHTVANDIHRKRPGAKVAVIPFYVEHLEARSRRDELPWPDDSVIIGHCGYLTVNRQVRLLIKTFAHLKETRPELRLLIVGEIVNQEVDLASLINEFGLEDAVHATGFVADRQAFLNWIATSDYLVNLRYPTMGETSGTALLALALARPVILFDHGWYGELPDEVCYQIPVMDENALYQAMDTLATQPEIRKQIGDTALHYVNEEHNPRQIAGQFLHFFNQVLLKP